MIHATKMDFVTEGTKEEMHLWQHEMIENYAYITVQLPPLNRSFWCWRMAFLFFLLFLYHTDE